MDKTGIVKAAIKNYREKDKHKDGTNGIAEQGIEKHKKSDVGHVSDVTPIRGLNSPVKLVKNYIAALANWS